MAGIPKIRIAEIEIEYKDLLKAQAEIQEQIRATREEMQLLEATQDVLRRAGKQDSEQYQQNAKAIELQKVSMAGLKTEYKNNERVLASAASLKNEELGTIQKLDEQNKKLRASLRALDLTTEAGRKTQKEYIAQINSNTEFIKKNSDAAIQQKMNIGNYKSALDLLPGSMKNVATGFQTAGNAAKMFMANPIVLAIAAIVGVVVGLVKAFKNTEEGGDRLKKKFDQIKAVVDVLKDRIENFALGLAKVFSGEQKLKDLKGTFAGMGDEIQRDVRLAGELRDRLEELENKEIDLITTSALRRTEIKKLQEAAADQNKTDGERARLLQQANRLIEEEAKAQQAVKLTRIANELAMTDEAAVLDRINQLRKEGKQITLEEIGLSNSTNVDRKRVNELIAEYIDLEAQAASQKKETTSQISGLLKREMAEREKQLEQENEIIHKYYDEQYKAAEAEMLAEIELEKQKLAEKERLRQEDVARQKQWDEEMAAFRLEKAITDAENARIAKEFEMNDRFQVELDALKREEEAEIQAALKTGASVALITKKFAAIEKVIEREKQMAKMNIAAGFAGAISDLLGKETAAGKAAAIVQTVINTYKGAMSAFAETPGGVIIKSAAAATAVVTGVAAIRNILKAGGGGSGGASTSVSDIAGAGGGGTGLAGNPSPTYVSNVSAPQTVLVLEEFQVVQDTSVKVKKAGEL
jgi:hypothetical protein